MLPRTTQQSHSAALGRESQIEPWLAIANTLLAGAKARSERRNQDAAATDSRSSTKSCRRRGAGSQKKTPLSKEEECFFLTSPFIEPGGELTRKAGPAPARQSKIKGWLSPRASLLKTIEV